MSKILGFAACAAMAAMLAGCKDNNPKPESKAEGLLNKAETVVDNAAAAAEEAVKEAAE